MGIEFACLRVFLGARQTLYPPLGQPRNQRFSIFCEFVYEKLLLSKSRPFTVARQYIFSIRQRLLFCFVVSVNLCRPYTTPEKRREQPNEFYSTSLL